MNNEMMLKLIEQEIRIAQNDRKNFIVNKHNLKLAKDAIKYSKRIKKIFGLDEEVEDVISENPEIEKALTVLHNEIDNLIIEFQDKIRQYE